MFQRKSAPVIAAAALVGLAAVATGPASAQAPAGPGAAGEIVDSEGQAIGSVNVNQLANGLQIIATAEDVPAGVHGFHVHAVGACTAPDFRSAGGHAAVDGQTHGSHVGDLPPLLVKRNGTATLRVTTDRFELTRLTDVDGSAIIVHALPDNLANIPPRYAPGGPDEETRNTGDAGGRIACGVVGD